MKFLGGNGGDRCQGLAVDAQGRVYVTGQTSSTDFVVRFPAGTAGYDKTPDGNLDAYVAILKIGRAHV